MAHECRKGDGKKTTLYTLLPGRASIWCVMEAVWRPTATCAVPLSRRHTSRVWTRRRLTRDRRAGAGRGCLRGCLRSRWRAACGVRGGLCTVVPPLGSHSVEPRLPSTPEMVCVLHSRGGEATTLPQPAAEMLGCLDGDLLDLSRSTLRYSNF